MYLIDSPKYFSFIPLCYNVKVADQTSTKVGEQIRVTRVCGSRVFMYKHWRVRRAANI